MSLGVSAATVPAVMVQTPVSSGSPAAKAEGSTSESIGPSNDKTPNVAAAEERAVAKPGDRAQYLELGGLYEKLDDVESATKAYEAALASTSETVWRPALNALERIRGKGLARHIPPIVREPVVTYFKLLVQVLIYLALIIGTVLSLGLVGKLNRWNRKRRNARAKLEILPFVTNASDSTGSRYFGSVVGSLLHLMQRQTSLGKVLTPDSVLPQMRSKTLFEYATEAAVTLAPTARPIVEWFLRKLYEPEYQVEGSTLIVGKRVHIVVELKYRGELRRTWAATYRTEEALDRLRDLAYELLQSTKRIR